VTVLHLINRAPPADALARCLASLTAQDTVLFYESGVLACCAGALTSSARSSRVRFVALRVDVEAFGAASRLDPAVEIVDDVDFVDLVASHQPIVSWA